jgi:hypothetical protein
MSDPQLEIPSEKHAEFKVTVRRSEDVSALLKALIAAQKEFGAIIRGEENQAYKRGGGFSKYADLATVVEATQPALLKNGLTIIQHVQGHHETRETIVTTTLFHESGQFIESDLSVPSVNQQGRFDPQTVASASTYARRYAWQGITGTAPEDDDGNKASGIGSHAEAKAVGEAKVARAREKASPSVATPVPALFYTEPLNHNGHFLEFINIREYLSTRQDIEDSLRLIFTTHRAKKTKDETVLVPSAELQPLLEKLVGELGLTVKKLEANG